MTEICLSCGGRMHYDNVQEIMACTECGGTRGLRLPDHGDTAARYRSEYLRTMGVGALLSGLIPQAEQCFFGLIDYDQSDWRGWFLIAWIEFAGSDKGESLDAPGRGLPSLRHAASLAAEPGEFIAFVEEFFTVYLDTAAGRYLNDAAISSVQHIIAPFGIDMLCLFQFAYLLTERFDWQPSEHFTQRLDNWIAGLAMRLFRQAEFSGIRLRLPVELLNQADIEGAEALFDWMDEMYDAILWVSARCGESFYELLLALRLDIAMKCMPQFADVCKTYTYTYPYQHDEAVAEASVAQLYSFMVLDTCLKVTSFDRSIKRFVVESVPLLPGLKVQWIPAGDNPDVEVIYEIPETQYARFFTQAKRLARELAQEDKSFHVPDCLGESA